MLVYISLNKIRYCSNMKSKELWCICPIKSCFYEFSLAGLKQPLLRTIPSLLQRLASSEELIQYLMDCKTLFPHLGEQPVSTLCEPSHFFNQLISGDYAHPVPQHELPLAKAQINTLSQPVQISRAYPLYNSLVFVLAKSFISWTSVFQVHLLNSWKLFSLIYYMYGPVTVS